MHKLVCHHLCTAVAELVPPQKPCWRCLVNGPWSSPFTTETLKTAAEERQRSVREDCHSWRCSYAWDFVVCGPASDMFVGM